MMTAKNVLRVYNISAIKSAPYKTIQSDVDGLRKLLKTRPAIVHQSETPSESELSLPDYPPRNAAHLIEVKCSYIDAAWGSGLLYVTRFVQGIGEWPDNEQLVYLLQGLSKDDRFYVSADFRVTHPALEHAKPRSGSNDDSEKLTARLASIMSKDRDDSFSPSLRSIRNWLLTLKIE